MYEINLEVTSDIEVEANMWLNLKTDLIWPSERPTRAKVAQYFGLVTIV